MEDRLESSGYHYGFDRVIDELPALIWTSLPDGHCEFLNQRWFEYTDLDPATALGWGWQIVIHPDDREHMLETWRLIRASGEARDLEARIRRHDGVYRWFLFRTCPIKDESGEIVKWCGMNTDIEERKQEEKLLIESEQRFRAIFDEAGAGIALADLTPGTPIKTNRALQNMLGCSEEELSRFETYNDLTFAADRENDAATFRELYEGRRDGLRMEKHFVRRDGTSVWTNVIFTLLRDREQLPRYIIAILEDITERKRVVEELQAKQELLDLAQKTARAMAFDWYIQNDVNAWSPEQEALYGLEPGTFDGTFESWKKLIHQKDWPLVVEALIRAQKTGDISAEFRVVWPDGSTHWLAANGQMFFNAHGEPYRMVGFTADVTRRKLVEEELRRSEAFLAEGQRLSLTGSFSWRLDTDEVIFSDQSRRIFDFGPDEMVTLNMIGARVHPEDAPAINEKIVNARISNDDQDFENRLQMPDGTVKHIHTIAHCIQSDDGRQEYLGAIQDITDRLHSEAALSELRSELAHVTRVSSLGAMTASIAHEVNQPLSGIMTNASTCLRMLGADPPNVAGAVETARRTIRDANRASDVITRLRALFRKKDTTIEPLDLNEAAREVVALSLGDLQRNRVILQSDLDEGIPPVVGDRVQLQQVILNLLRNASDAMNAVDDRPRQLFIKTGREDDAVLLSVRDAGVGFDPQTTEKLFDGFYTTKKDGMGIGLSVSKSIVESHRGRLWARLNDGPGATFCFSLPCPSESISAGEIQTHDQQNNKQIARDA